MRGFNMESLKLREDGVEMSIWCKAFAGRYLWKAFVGGILASRPMLKPLIGLDALREAV